MNSASPRIRAARSVATLVVCLLTATGCDGPPTPPASRSLTVWFHSGRQAERETIEHQVAAFSARHPGLHVELTRIPEGSYNGQVQAAALAGDLPDVLEFDGPYVYNYVWQGKLRPIGRLLPAALREDLLDSIIEQGTYHGRLYTVATFDSGLGLFARRSQLEAVGARIPESPARAWTVDEFETLLHGLSRADPDGAVLDLKLNYPDEFFTYAYSPPIQSAGGDLIDRSDYQSAQGVLDGPAAMSAMHRIQGWIESGLVDPNVDDAAFVQGRVALSWTGHWEFDRNRRAAGGDLVLVPLPDFGTGMRTAQGSWNWGITTSCENPGDAIEFLRFLLEPEQILAITQANGAVPATHTAIARSKRYGPGGALHLFARQLAEGYSVPRPRTPAYPVISAAFTEAFRAIRNGSDVQSALDRAATTIDRDIRDNRGYPVRDSGTGGSPALRESLP